MRGIESLKHGNKSWCQLNELYAGSNFHKYSRKAAQEGDLGPLLYGSVSSACGGLIERYNDAFSTDNSVSVDINIVDLNNVLDSLVSFASTSGSRGEREGEMTRSV
jgi:hypothetical protein